MANAKFKRAVASPALIVLVALALRLLFAADYIRQNPRQALGVLPFLFEAGNIAHSLAIGTGFANPFRVSTGPTAWMTPIYPLLLAGVFRVFGSYTFSAYLAAAGLNILFVTAACFPIFYVGKRIGGLAVGAGAAWLWALFPNAILLTFESMWDASLDALLAALILWATLAIDGSRKTLHWVGYGLLWGFALMTNPTLASLLPLLLAWLAYRAWRVRRSSPQQPQPADPRFAKNAVLYAAWRPALALVVALLCCVPWTIRNYRAFHRLIPLRSVLGLQLWLGNNPNARQTWRAQLHPIFNESERAKYIRMGELAYMHQKMDAALSFMFAHPFRAAALARSRFVAIWSGGTPTPLDDFLHNPSLWFHYVLVWNLLASLGALTGIVLLFRRRNPYAFPLAAFPVVFPCAYYLTLAMPRYRLPIDPMVMLLTAVTLAAIFTRGRHEDNEKRPGGKAASGNPRAGG